MVMGNLVYLELEKFFSFKYFIRLLSPLDGGFFQHLILWLRLVVDYFS